MPTRPSRTSKRSDTLRRAPGQRSNLRVWNAMRRYFPKSVAEAVDEIFADGPLTHVEGQAIAAAMLLNAANRRTKPHKNAKQLASFARLLERTTRGSEPTSEARVTVVVPEGLREVPPPDDGDDLL